MGGAKPSQQALVEVCDIEAGAAFAAGVTDAPRRIVCLTEEPTEILYGLGEQERIVGISAYTERPPEARGDRLEVLLEAAVGQTELIDAGDPQHLRRCPRLLRYRHPYRCPHRQPLRFHQHPLLVPVLAALQAPVRA